MGFDGAHIAARERSAEGLPCSIPQNILHSAQHNRPHDAAQVLAADSGAPADLLGDCEFGGRHGREHGSECVVQSLCSRAEW